MRAAPDGAAEEADTGTQSLERSTDTNAVARPPRAGTRRDPSPEPPELPASLEEPMSDSMHPNDELESNRPGTDAGLDDTFSTPRRPRWIASAVLLSAITVAGAALAAWKIDTLRDADAAAAAQPEWPEVVTVATSEPREHRPTVTAIGTVLATRSVTLRNELSGTVEQVRLVPGAIVEAGTVLVQLDVSVERAELAAQRARAALAESLLERYRQASENRSVSASEVDRARAELDVARAEIARVEAVIEKKTLRAPFRSRVGLADVHRGQYLDEGTVLTTLQGIDEAAHVDFSVAQRVAAGLEPGDTVRVRATGAAEPLAGTIVAVDARVDPATRNALVRARVDDPAGFVAPGASVRVEVPDGEARTAVAVPVSALRKGPAGDHVFVVATAEDGKPRAHVRAVRSGAVLGDRVLILDGLGAGEQVAASGSFTLREAARVAVAEPAAAAEGVAR
jgi:membrane fusion protein (multidrug efflux system)